MPKELENNWWFGFRQILPKPPGRAIAEGPYGSYEDALREGEQAKAWDCTVSVPFIAATEEEAAQKAEQLTP